jgi:hypothetical protein
MKTLENKSQRAMTLFPSKLAALAVAILVTGAFALLVSSFSEQAVAAPVNSHAFAVGGFLAMDGSQIAFAAQINPQTPTKFAGHVVETDASGVSRHGPVTCVIVSPPKAVVIYKITKSDIQFEEDFGLSRGFEVIDGGEPPTGMDMYKAKGNPNCGFDMNAYVPVVRGNIVVQGP